MACVLSLGAGGLLPVRAEAVQVPLRCRIQGGSWQPCRMTIERIGEHWWLEVGNERLEFRSDGRGQVTLNDGKGQARQVVPAWSEEQALCWDGVCALGSFPLD
jgi:hypothetical protein